MIRRNLNQTTSRKRVPFKLTIKKKLGVNKARGIKYNQKEVSLLSILQNQTGNKLKDNRNLKLSREHKKVDPIAFYKQSDPRAPHGFQSVERKKRINLKIKQKSTNRNNPVLYIEGLNYGIINNI